MKVRVCPLCHAIRVNGEWNHPRKYNKAFLLKVFSTEGEKMQNVERSEFCDRCELFLNGGLDE